VVFVSFPGVARRLSAIVGNPRVGSPAPEVSVLHVPRVAGPTPDAPVEDESARAGDLAPEVLRGRRRLWLAVFRTALYVVVAAVVLNTFMNRWGFRARSPRYGFTALMTQGGHRPFVFRALTPALVNGVTSLLPASRLEEIVEWDLARPVAEHPSLSAHRRFAWGPNPTPAHYVAYELLWGVVFLLLLAMRHLTRVARFPDPVADWAPIAALLLLPLSFSRGGYLYDFPELLLATIAVALLLERRWLLYYACFALACLNKESAVLLAVYFLALHGGQMAHRRMALHAMAHVIIGLPILTWQRLTFAPNPGAYAEFQLWDNVRFLSSPEPWIRLWDPYGPLLPFPGPFNVVSIALFGAAALLFWREKPHRLRVAFVAMMAVLVPLCMVFGTLDEVRNLSLAFPTAYLLTCHTAARLYGMPSAAPS
jgi:hypothetical protein